MDLKWTLVAESYFDQLSPAEQGKVLHAVERLPEEWEKLEGDRLYRLAGDEANVYVLRVGEAFRVVLKREPDLISVVDVVRKAQIEGLRRLFGTAHAVAR
jgi:hypothetical protein